MSHRFWLCLTATILLSSIAATLYGLYARTLELSYQRGIAAAELTCLKQQMDAVRSATSKHETIKRTVARIPDSDVDRRLRDLGIMRSDQDR